jgi:hypothetical protein
MSRRRVKLFFAEKSKLQRFAADKVQHAVPHQGGKIQ